MGGLGGGGGGGYVVISSFAQHARIRCWAMACFVHYIIVRVHLQHCKEKLFITRR